ncbi:MULTISPECIES: YjiH family protein [Staphylococcus]|jgi:nucleoside recognition membrane protein YjiH|uniref:YjiH family protein n=1 Tax=Staphylococcus TaxID=1279 RepID=UPI0001A5C7AC|nr:MULTISPECIES: YjiH family protein [Staphylococcus]EEQ80681.1 transporter gate domain protein [Staphylococcus warneri L37603]MBO0377788.1 YjiH family protein [Staphylococcus warneri]MCI2789043.1 YjiH family protein [Staphylococcus warneri]MCJ1804987.1 YjiH family protein [Staphylococcus warneri]QKI07255.1 YjiH family protein [Staphylococcus warneri]
MNRYTKQEIIKGRIKFITMSLIGIILFLIPIPVEQDGKKQTTLPVAFLANWLKDIVGGAMPFIIVTIITLSAILTLICSTILKDKLDPKGLLYNAFNVNVSWIILRVLAVIFAWMTLLKVGPKMIYSEDTGGLVFSSLLPTLVAVFLFAALFLPLLMEYGLLELLGPLFRPVMRPLFTLPGRSTVDNLASFIGDGTVGVLITSRQYEEGFYSRREATVISTTFSVVSITFAIIIADTVKMQDQFFLFYLSVIISCLIAAVIMPRIWPLNKIPDEYAKDVSSDARTEQLPESKTAIGHGFDMATEVGIKAPGVKDFFKSGLKTVVDMWFVILPVVMSIGTIATIIANYTPIFELIGKPFVPFLQLLQIPEATHASQTILIGFADMFLPSILIESAHSDLTRFVIGALSITQLIYLSEVGGVILGSKIPVNIGKLFVIFLIRTIITLPIITLIAHLFL